MDYMKCGHCFFEFEPEREEEVFAYSDDIKHIVIYNYECTNCKGPNLSYVAFWLEDHGGPVLPIWPQARSVPCPKEVPHTIAEDYREACLVFPISFKASAALSRRCLQNILHDAAKIQARTLDQEIQMVINSGQLPSYIIDSIDAIRNVGNFAAHPTKSGNTGEIIDVKREEAEWNLDVLESLFDFYYVQPAKITKKRDALNAKLSEAGKPPMK
jgi:hypothetical protein